MALHVQAVYEHGLLRLLSPVDLVEGQEVDITLAIAQEARIEALTEEEELIRKALSGYVRWHNPYDNRHAEVEALAQQLAEELTKGGVTSQQIIDGRGER